MNTYQLISCSLRNHILDSVSRLTCRTQVPAKVMSSLISEGIDPLVEPSLEDMKQLLVDAFRFFDRENTKTTDVPPDKSNSLSPSFSPKAFSDTSVANSLC